MYVHDLRPVTGSYAEMVRMLACVDPDKPVVFVGWLGTFRFHSTGATEATFLERLHALSESPPLLHRGFYSCRKGRCKFSLRSAPGIGEIVIDGPSSVYLAPSLISHYVAHHRYCPPREFIDAVMRCSLPGSGDYARTVGRFRP